MSNVRLHNRKVVAYSQERVVNGWEFQSLDTLQRGFPLFDGDGLLDAALDGDSDFGQIER